jgi:hypothetical protein
VERSEVRGGRLGGRWICSGGSRGTGRHGLLLRLRGLWELEEGVLAVKTPDDEPGGVRLKVATVVAQAALKATRAAHSLARCGRCGLRGRARVAGSCVRSAVLGALRWMRSAGCAVG